MIKFEVDEQKELLHFECKGEPKEVAIDAVVCIRKAYDAIKEMDEESAADFIMFILLQLGDPKSDFYADVDWETEGWEDTKC